MHFFWRMGWRRARLIGLVWPAAFALFFALGGCDRPPPPPPMAALAPPPAGISAAPQTAKLAYRHTLDLEMPAASVEPHYDRAVKTCLENAALNCVVINASIRMGDADDPLRGVNPSASLTVRVPHNAVAAFEADLLAPLPGETAGDAILHARSTSAEDLTYVIADVERRQAQLTDYRDRLMELAKRADVKVEDLIKIESELSKTQSELEALAGQKRTLDQRVDTEIISVSFDTRSSAADFSGPVIRAWHQAGRVLGESTGSALRFAIGALPWLPFVAIGLLLLRLAFRRWRP